MVMSDSSAVIAVIVFVGTAPTFVVGAMQNFASIRAAC
jgi:hypothetical protein